jgi:NAD/NADP transhydrogenase beta subunit
MTTKNTTPADYFQSRCSKKPLPLYEVEILSGLILLMSLAYGYYLVDTIVQAQRMDVFLSALGYGRYGYGGATLDLHILIDAAVIVASATTLLISLIVNSKNRSQHSVEEAEEQQKAREERRDRLVQDIKSSGETLKKAVKKVSQIVAQTKTPAKPVAKRTVKAKAKVQEKPESTTFTRLIDSFVETPKK